MQDTEPEKFEASERATKFYLLTPPPTIASLDWANVDGTFTAGSWIAINGKNLGGEFYTSDIWIDSRSERVRLNVTQANADRIEALLPENIEPGDHQLYVERMRRDGKADSSKSVTIMVVSP